MSTAFMVFGFVVFIGYFLDKLEEAKREIAVKNATMKEFEELEARRKEHK